MPEVYQEEDISSTLAQQPVRPLLSMASASGFGGVQPLQLVTGCSGHNACQHGDDKKPSVKIRIPGLMGQENEHDMIMSGREGEQGQETPHEHSVFAPKIISTLFSRAVCDKLHMRRKFSYLKQSRHRAF